MPTCLPDLLPGLKEGACNTPAAKSSLSDRPGIARPAPFFRL